MLNRAASALVMLAAIGCAADGLADDTWTRRLIWTPETVVTTSLTIDTADGFRAFTEGGVAREGAALRWDATQDLWIRLPWTSRYPATVVLQARAVGSLASPGQLHASINGVAQKVPLRVTSQWTGLTIRIPAGALEYPTATPHYTNDKLVTQLQLTSAGIQHLEIRSITMELQESMVRLNNETRRSLIVDGTASLEAVMTIPRDGAQLSVGYALLKEWQRAADGRTAQFTIDIEDVSLFSDTITTSRERPARWRDANIDLMPYAGRRVRLRFAMASGDGPAYGLWSLPALYRTQPPQPDARPNIILVSIDALRADHLSHEGYGRPTTPTLDAWAEGGVRCRQAIAQSNWTLTSMASLITGIHPSRHNVLREDQRLPAALAVLPAWFRQAGYVTAVAQSNQWLHEQYGFCQGVDHYYFDPGSSPESPIRADAQMVYVRQWIERFRQQPFFLWLHLIEAHAPYGGYLPPDSITQFGLSELDKYDAAIRMLDDRLAALRQALRDQGIEDRTLIVVTSDHGEEFGDHGGTEHGRTLYQEMLHIPLIFYWPAGLPAGRVVEPIVQHIDVFPTLAELAGLPAPPVDGKSLVPLMRAGTGAGAQPAFSQSGSLDPERLALISVITPDGWKGIEDLKDGRIAVYHLTLDPHEQQDLNAHHAARTQALQQLLDAWRSQKTIVEASPPVVLDRAAKERLRSLGYLQ